MKNFVLILFLSVILMSCEDPNTAKNEGSQSQLLISHGWQLDKFTDLQGNMINEGSLNSSARLLYGLVIDFRANNEVRGLDEKTKSIINRGTWGLTDNGSTLQIDIVAFEGDFKIVELKNKTMILQAKTENRLIGVGPEINLVFKEFNL